MGGADVSLKNGHELTYKKLMDKLIFPTGILFKQSISFPFGLGALRFTYTFFVNKTLFPEKKKLSR